MLNSRKACLHIASDIRGRGNYPFLAGPEGDGFKNMLFSMRHLREALAGHGVDLATPDINPPDECFLLFCWDNPHTVQAVKKPGQTWCLLINDPPMYYPESWQREHHARYDFVLTFDETLVDNKKYFYYPMAVDTEYFSVPEIVSEDEWAGRRLATFVGHAVHKYEDKANPGSTLHRRYRTIAWYGRNHPGDFAFYGGTFLKRDYYFAFRGVSVLRRVVPKRIFSLVAKYAQRHLISVFSGELHPLEKFEVIKKYNFYYCYENTVGINGYVSEKLFDCFYSGVVPIYWGAPNIKALIPYECYIDGDRFETDKDLYTFIKGMSYDAYRGYLQQARAFLSSKEMERFTVRNSIDCVLKPLADVLAGQSHGMHQARS
jgi:hypothetical protein